MKSVSSPETKPKEALTRIIIWGSETLDPPDSLQLTMSLFEPWETNYPTRYQVPACNTLKNPLTKLYKDV